MVYCTVPASGMAFKKLTSTLYMYFVLHVLCFTWLTQYVVACFEKQILNGHFVESKIQFIGGNNCRLSSLAVLSTFLINSFSSTDQLPGTC